MRPPPPRPTLRLRLTLPPLLALAAFALVLTACAAGEESFPTDLSDEAYPLEAMLLDLADLPLAMENERTQTFDNGEWAALFNSEDLRAKRNQLDARGRVLGALREFSWEQPNVHFGGPVIITMQATLYADVAAARDSMSRFCGALIDEAAAVDLIDFWVAPIADGSQGFILGERHETLGRLVEAYVCFRTGRVVHAVAQFGLEGTEDIALLHRIAQRMEERVRATFAGLDPAEASGESPAPES